MKKKGDYQIPFDKDGNQQDYPERQWYCKGDKSYYKYPEWRDNVEFEDTLTLETYGRGRSSVTFTMRRKNGKTVSVFVSDFCDMAKSRAFGEFDAGAITGRFTFCKKGANYGCRMVDL
jgi:hypothetical protein